MNALNETIRVEIDVRTPSTCPVAAASETTGAPVETVTRASGRNMGPHVDEEFTIASDATVDLETYDAVEGADRIFDLDSHAVYRFTRSAASPCVCDRIEELGWPVSDISAENGSLLVTCYVDDQAGFAALMSDLQDRFGDVRVRRLLRSESDGNGNGPLVLEVDSLTARQREVLETAHEMGYFEYPRESNAGDVAEALGITRSTFGEHLAAAQRKVLQTLG
ncbi:helix-turn-helix domain-containing protein [Natronosalvus rutilus]|uniref:Helix-turn-helix domain-containing protein n=1 Tax=Natronosalvus rutilus TaxID=2953753 RepID=A0A9E7N7I4_9EURY|nr:helix-turn-helix domain-containing protein [Natronosalvus rutilus]UTF52341.1 helix-turn-helix domain-containing protein [Natronosalvus rutilus]